MHHQQVSLFGAGPPALGDLDAVRRTHLGRGAWIDIAARLAGGADDLFDDWPRGCPGAPSGGRMYDDVVDVPRLLAHYGERRAAAASGARPRPASG